MWLISPFASLKRSAGQQLPVRRAEGRRRQRRPDAFRARPRLEALEDRTLLSISWVAMGAGEWSDPSNWLDDMQRHRVPGPVDDVVLPAFQGTYTVSQPSACRSLRFDDPAALSIQSGVILAVYGPATLNGAANIDGTLESRANDPWTLNGAVTLSGVLNLPGGGLHGFLRHQRARDVDRRR